MDNKIILGILTFLIISSGVIYITFMDNARIRVDEDKTTFYVPHEDYSWIWTVSGREYNALFDGTSKMNRDVSNIKIESIFNNETNKATIKRTTPYIRGPVIVDTYQLDGDIEDIERFPISHTVEIFNASKYFYRYEVRDLTYDGDTRKLLGEILLEFGKKMKVQLAPNYRWAWIYKTGLVKAQYDIPSDYEKFKVRLFDPPQGTRNIGYEYLNSSGGIVNDSEATIIHLWNFQDDYYFNKSSGIQFSNHFNEYWTHNIFCAGYKAGGIWYYDCNDALPFNSNIKTDNSTYVNYTLWRDKTIGTKTVRLGLRYHLRLDDESLSIQLSVENIGGEDITNDLGFAWVVNDIKINNDSQGDSIFINYTDYDLQNVSSLNFTNLDNSYYRLHENSFIQLDWNNNLNYKVEIKNTSQYNARVNLGINAGTLSIGQEKHTTLYWKDPITFEDAVESGITGDLWDTPLVWQHDITCGNDLVLIVGIAIDSEPAIAVKTIRYNGTALSKISRVSTVDEQVQAELWNLTNPDCGVPLWVNVTWEDDSNEEAAGMSAVYYGVDYINISSLNSSRSDQSESSNLSVPSSSENNWVVNIFALDVDAGSGISVSGDNAVQRGYRDEITAITVAFADGNDTDGEVTMGWSGFNDEWVQIGVELIPVIGVINVTLSSPANASTGLPADLSFSANISADVTYPTGDFVNFSLYTNTTGSWGLNQTKYPEMPINAVDDLIQGINMTDNVLYLRFNSDSEYGETGSQAYDYSGNNNYAGIKLAVITDEGKMWRGLKINRSVNANVTVNDSATIRVDNKSTFMAWIKPAQAANFGGVDMTIFAKKSAAGNANYYFELRQADSKLNLYLSGPGYKAGTKTDWNANQWYHVAATWNGSKVVLYVDGEVDNIVAASGSMAAYNSGLLHIGMWTDVGNNRFNGTIDEAIIFNRTLTSTEVQKIYNLTKDYKVNFTVENIADGTYDWNVLACDDGNYNAWAQDNWTFTVGTEGEADINFTTPLPIGVIRFQNCSPDWEFLSEPAGQTSTIPAINATNNGTATGDFTINITGTPNTNWTLFASNQSDLSQNITLSTTAQTIWESVLSGQSKNVWLFANCSYVSQNPGVSIDMQAS